MTLINNSLKNEWKVEPWAVSGIASGSSGQWQCSSGGSVADEGREDSQ